MTDKKETTRIFTFSPMKESISEKAARWATYFMIFVFGCCVFLAIGWFGFQMERLRFEYVYKDSVEALIKGNK